MKNKKKEKVEKIKKPLDPKKEKKQTIIGMCITVTASIVVGVCIGTILQATLNGGNSNQNFDEDLYKDDINAIKTKYENAISQNVSDFSKALTPVEMLQISFDLFNGTNYMNECYGINNNDYSGDQIITSMRAVYNDVVYSESLSHGSMVKLGTRYFQKGDSITYYEAEKYELLEDNKIVLATYKSKENMMPAENYETKFGAPMSAPTNLIISSKTVKENTTPTVTKTTDGYKMVIELSDDATAKYKTQIVNMDSKVSGVKPFTLLKLECELDNTLYLRSLTTYEEYVTIALGVIPAPCHARLINKYYYEKDGLTRDSFPSGTESYDQYRKGI